MKYIIGGDTEAHLQPDNNLAYRHGWGWTVVHHATSSFKLVHLSYNKYNKSYTKTDFDQISPVGQAPKSIRGRNCRKLPNKFKMDDFQLVLWVKEAFLCMSMINR